MLTERQSLILKQIVDTYSATGEPVGSKSLAQRLPIRVSSATIRNDMSILSANDYIEKLHTSSGRVPSERGYRYYLDHLAEPAPPDAQYQQYIQELLGGSFQQLDDIVRQSAEVLSELTEYPAITISPESQTGEIVQHLQVLKLNGHHLMAVVIMNTGQVENQAFVVHEDWSTAQLEKATNILNETYAEQPFSLVVKDLATNRLQSLAAVVPNLAVLRHVFQYVLQKFTRDQFFLSGRTKLFPVGVANADDYGQSNSLVDINDDLLSIVDGVISPLSVQLGFELPNNSLRSYSIVSGLYDVGVHGIGRIAIIGPTRMEYPKVMGLVDAFRTELQNRISGYYHGYE
ncbi:Heat-inducible transcription repressor HrcA [Fructilactobacillus florum 8D]|uniref:Heat-inducible transcription repressor HrcA n=1 Tax=Fructilactobacillus florum 8D TaxID=1221538 RepID=W9EMN2_9LACO|nr:heat-inducible transcriptional repressor HrcA [Fructilactobacillus florum]ETO40899.1 Heat-inducible transcription repressor HrcA [Fructilactobacillus florum 8D]